MKNFLSASAIVLMVSVAVIAKGELPAIVNLPHTFSGISQYGSIDINKDGVRDFIVEFETYSSGMVPGACHIYSVSSGNAVIGEPENPPRAPMANPALSVSGMYFTSQLPKGTLVGSTAPDGSSWIDQSWFLTSARPSSPLGSSYIDGTNSGYVGAYFVAGSNNYYGWLNVTIDTDGEWVAVNSAGYNSSPSTPIPAGLNDPFAVPIPLVASILGFGLIGGGIFLKKRKMRVANS
jgi:hypothetical protein